MLARALRAAERGLDRFFGAHANPLRQLGAAAWWLFWAAVASGVYVYAFYDTGSSASYASIERLSSAPRALDGLMRSTHRYASDGLMLVTVLHLMREFAYGRYRGFRAFTWATGVPLVGLALASGVVGYWLVWDTLAQFVATAAGEWLAVLPGFGPAMVRNFIAPEAVTDRLFSLLAFAHIGVSLLLLLGMWIHVQRLTRARVRPDAHLGWGLVGVLAALALVVPVASHPQADLSRLPSVVALDSYYLFAFPFADVVPPRALWVVTAAAAFLLFALPWLVPGRRAPPAVVHADQCNGCALCNADCPYGAVRMVPGPAGGLPRAEIADALCAGCGICVGACPSATPFRTTAAFTSGIELPQRPLVALRAHLDRALRSAAAPAVVAIGCDCGLPLTTLAASGTATVSLPCIGMLPPSFVDYALARGAAGVMIVDCGPDDCEFRFGAAWLAARLAGERSPRARLARDSVRVLTLEAARDSAALASELDAFRAFLRAQRGAKECAHA